MKRSLSVFFFFLFCFSGKAQTFLNGSFENHTATVDQINLSNGAFNAIMANTVAFGSFGDMDIITSATYCGLAQDRCWYVALTGSTTDAITMELSAPLVTGNSYTISFFDKGCWGTFSGSAPPVEVGLSTVPGALGTPIYNAPAPVNNVWTQRTFTFVAPNNGQYISVHLPTGGLGDWTQIDNFSFTATPTTLPCNPNALTASFTTTNNICPGTCINFTDNSTGTPNPNSWSWTFPGGIPASSTAQNPANICYNTPGTYTATLTVSNGSGTSTTSQTITVASLVVSAGNNTSICYNSSATLTGSGAVSYTWTPAGSLSSSTGTSVTATPTATTTYTVTGTDANGCTDTSTVTVTVNPQPVINAGNPVTICPGGNATLTATGAVSYTWSPASSLSSTTGASVTATPTTTTLYTVIGVDANGCSDTATTLVNVLPPPAVTASTSPASVCPGGSTSLSASGATSYSWSPATGLSNTTSANPTCTPTATTTYTVTGTDANGCTATATVTVTVNPPPVANAGPDQTICVANSTTLNASGGVSYSWSPATGLSNTSVANPTANPTATTTYTVIVTDANGCTATDMITVTVVPPPVATASGTQAICLGESAVLNAGGGGTYAWSPSGSLSNSTSSNPTASPLTTTTYTVTVSNGGCTDTATVTVTVNNPPAAGAGPDQTITYGNSTVLTGSGGGSYAWSPPNGLSCTNCPTPSASPSTTTTYVVTVTDANGCTSTDTVTVYVDYVCGKVFVPNAFSPNGSGYNDVLYVRGNCIVELHFMVYDRWGEKVFESSDPALGWDGTVNGKVLDPAVFLYYYEAKLINGETVTGKGNVSLIR
ncbi:MAG: PKD domain-containing protein [Bacteroidota bacterium]